MNIMKEIQLRNRIIAEFYAPAMALATKALYIKRSMKDNLNVHFNVSN